MTMGYIIKVISVIYVEKVGHLHLWTQVKYYKCYNTVLKEISSCGVFVGISSQMFVQSPV